MWAQRYEFYVNEQLVSTGSMGPMAVSLPSGLLDLSKPIHIAIKVLPGNLNYQGISNYGRVLIAPQSVIAPLVLDTFNIQFIYPLLFLLPRIAFAALFCFLFLFLSRNSDHFAFLLFAFAGVLKLTLWMDYAHQYLPPTVDGRWAYQLIYPLEQALLILFIQRFFRKDDPVFDRVLYMICLGLAVLAGYGILSGPGSLNIALLETLRRLIKLTAMIYGAYLALEATLYLAWSKRSPNRLTSTFVLFVFFAVAIVMAAIDLTGVIPADSRDFVSYSVELVMFVILAALTALDFSAITLQRKKSVDTLNKVVDPRVAQSMLTSHGPMIPQRANIAVMFSDIRNFTNTSESNSAEEVVSFLNRYFPQVVACIQARSGTVDKFIGDCVMAIWGMPRQDPDAMVHAAETALDLRRNLAAFNAESRRVSGLQIDIGIGLHYGLPWLVRSVAKTAANTPQSGILLILHQGLRDSRNTTELILLFQKWSGRLLATGQWQHALTRLHYFAADSHVHLSIDRPLDRAEN